MNYIVKTPHFTYKLVVTELFQPLHIKKYIVGNDKTPCLELSVFMPDNNDIQHLITEASFFKIDALKECSLSGNGGFGTELLYSIISIIKANHPYVNQLSLYDTSYIPCNREENDTLDLITYNIALYGKTWYELKAGAHLEKNQEKYNKEIAKYISLIPRNTFSFRQFYEKIIKNTFALYFIHTNLDDITTKYNTSESFPEFFRYLSNLIPKEHKCKFFKDWLEGFIESQITIKREWKINIDTNPILNDVLNVSKKRSIRSRTIKNKRTND